MHQAQHDVYGSIILAATPMFFDRRLPKPGDVATGAPAGAISPFADRADWGTAGWKIGIQLRGHALRETSPVPLLMSLLKEFPGPAGKSPLLFTALAELYNNALDHGVLKLDSSLKAHDFETYLDARDQRLAHPGNGSVSVEVDCAYAGDTGKLELHVEDSGAGFDPSQVRPPAENAAYGRGIHLVRNVCESLEYKGAGNRALATYVWRPGAEAETKP